MFRRILIVVSVVVSAVVAAESSSVVTAADAQPDYATLLTNCTTSAANEPCVQTSEAQPLSPVAIFAECSVSVTNFCYTATVDGQPAPSQLKFVARVTASDISDVSNRDAQYDATFMAFRVPDLHTFSRTESFGWGKPPSDQSGDAGKIDLTGVVTSSSVIKVVLKYKTTKIPQYSVLVAEAGTMDFALSDQDVTVTLEGKPALVAVETIAQNIDYDNPQERSDDPTLPWTNRCGVPSMRFVVCNVEKADSTPLIFYSRSSTFVNSPGADVPGPIWVSTNATYFHQPSIDIDAKGKKIFQVKTAAPHLRTDGTENQGSFTAFVSTGILKEWGIEKTEAALDKSLSTSVTRGSETKSVERSFVISDAGVRINFPKLTYSAPIVSVGQKEEVAVTTTTSPVTTTAPATTAPPVKQVVKTVKRGKSTPLTRLIALKGKGKAKWKTSGGCKIVKTKLVAPKKKATCSLTLSQAKYKKTPASSRKITIKVT
jgi:hypothetical protein